MLSEKIYTTLKNPVITEKAAIETSTYKKAYVKLADGKEINLENPFK
jgi:ribosomal protein L23